MAMQQIARWYIQCYIPWIFRITPLEYPMTTISRYLWLYLVIKHYQTWLAGRFPTSMVFPTIKPPLSSGISHHFPIVFPMFSHRFPIHWCGNFMPAIRDPKHPFHPPSNLQVFGAKGTELAQSGVGGQGDECPIGGPFLAKTSWMDFSDFSDCGELSWRKFWEEKWDMGYIYIYT